ncbi:MAG: HK97 family phage prohead protease [Pseudonocardiaceae bacterium]
MIDIKAMRERAAAARREAIEDTSPAGIARARSAPPLDVGQSRSLTFPAVLRARLEHREGAAEGDAPWHHLAGVASVVNTPYEMWDMFGPYVETVASGAFDESLARSPDVAFLVNHKGLTMARTTNKTLTLAMAPQGLTTEAWLNPDRADVRDLAIAVNDGCVNQMSFAAQLVDGEWNDDYTAFCMTRLDLNCGDVSAVNFGANPHTSIAARAHRLLDEMDRLPSGAAMAALRQLELRLDMAPRESADNKDDSKQDSKEATGRSLSLVRCALLV